jgi:hypothetical protein
MVKDGDGNLVPYAAYDRETMVKYKPGATIRVTVAQQRSQPRHRLYRVMLRQVVKNTDLFTSEDSLHKTLLVANGVVEPLFTVDGEIIFIPSSTAFDKMLEEDFKDYFDRALLTIQQHILPGVDIEELMAEAREQAGWKEAA